MLRDGQKMYYQYFPDANRYDRFLLHPVDYDVIDVRDEPRRILQEWHPIPVQRSLKEPRVPCDFPSLVNYYMIPIMSQRAWDALHPLIGDCCEALPIVYPTGEPYYLIHVMQTIDCLDVNRSKFTRNKTTQRINRIYNYRFRDELLTGKHIFKLPIESAGELIVDDDFRNIVESNDLKGLLFKPLPMAE